MSHDFHISRSGDISQIVFMMINKVRLNQVLTWIFNRVLILQLRPNFHEWLEFMLTFESTQSFDSGLSLNIIVETHTININEISFSSFETG